MMQNCIGIIVYLESKIPGQMIQLLPAYNGSWSNNSGAPSIGATGRVGLGVTVGEGVVKANVALLGSCLLMQP